MALAAAALRGARVLRGGGLVRLLDLRAVAGFGVASDRGGVAAVAAGRVATGRGGVATGRVGVAAHGNRDRVAVPDLGVPRACVAAFAAGGGGRSAAGARVSLSHRRRVDLFLCGRWDGWGGGSKPNAGLAAPSPRAVLAARAANSRFMVVPLFELKLAGRSNGPPAAALVWVPKGLARALEQRDEWRRPAITGVHPQFRSEGRGEEKRESPAALGGEPSRLRRAPR